MSKCFVLFTLLAIMAVTSSLVEANNTTPKPVHKPRFLCPQQFGRFASHLDDTQYFLCVNYVPLKMTCPPGLYFFKDHGDCAGTGKFSMTPIKATTPKPHH